MLTPLSPSNNTFGGLSVKKVCPVIVMVLPLLDRLLVISEAEVDVVKVPVVVKDVVEVVEYDIVVWLGCLAVIPVLDTAVVEVFDRFVVGVED